MAAISRMGFVRHTEANDKLLNEILADQDDSILTFDSKNRISFDDALHHLMILGTTGSGKTASAILPVLNNLIARGHCGVASAVKGHAAPQFREVARRHGREKDIIEIGTAATSVRINILHGLTISEINDFIVDIVRATYNGQSNNEDFRLKGTSMACDCAEVLYWLSKKYQYIRPGISTIAEMINDYVTATRLYNFFRENVYDPLNKKQKRFVSKVDSDEHHIFKEHLPESKQKKTQNKERETQLAYSLSVVRPAFKQFMDADGVAEHFCAHDAPGLDTEDLIRNNRILITNFGPGAGAVGASILRCLLKRYYKTIVRKGRELTEGKKIFFVLDEYQAIADLSEDAYSDPDMIALGRELNCIFVLGTQSLSGLKYHCNKGNAEAGIERLLSNINTRIVLYTDCAQTQAMVERYDPDVAANRLEAGEAFTIRFDKARRMHFYGLEKLDNAYETTKDISNLEFDLHNPECPDPGHGFDLYDIWDRLDNESRTRRDETIAAAIDGLPFAQQITPNPQKPYEMGITEIIMKTFPNYFEDMSPQEIQIPIGWARTVIKALAALESSGMRFNITTFRIKNGTLMASRRMSISDSSDIPALVMLNFFLKATRQICSLCGNEIGENGQNHSNLHGKGNELPVCGDCLDKFGLSRPGRAPVHND